MSINNNKKISKICSWHLMTLVYCHFMTLISETQILWKAVYSRPPQSVLPTSGDNFREEKGRKSVRAISAECIYRCMLLFLDHILYRRAHFVRDMLANILRALDSTEICFLPITPVSSVWYSTGMWPGNCCLSKIRHFLRVLWCLSQPLTTKKPTTPMPSRLHS